MKNLTICDTHNDFLAELGCDEISSYVKACKKDNVERICASFWTTQKSKEEILKQLPLRAEILRKANSNFLLHIEDLWWVENDEDLQFLLKLHPFSCSLTWNNQNVLASGTKAEGGLTDWGKFVAQTLLNHGIVVDVAHLNRKCFWQVAKLVDKRLYCSHTGFCGIKRTSRNLTDKQIDCIVRSGGFVGLFFFDKCVKVSKNKVFDVADIVENLKYFSKRWGFENIGIGSDFYGIENCPHNLETYADFGNLYVALKKEGWKETQIENVFFKNFANFLTYFQKKKNV